MEKCKLYTVKEAAKLLEVSPNRLYGLIKEGKIKALDFGRWKIRADELDRFVNELPEVKG